MTPLHVLSCIPNFTLEMIQTLASKFPKAVFMKTKNDTLPGVDLHLVTENIVQGKLGVCTNGAFEYHQRDEIRSLMDRGTQYLSILFIV